MLYASSVEWIAVCPQRTSLLQVWHGSFRKDGWRHWECPMWRMTRVRFLLESNIKDDMGTVSQKSLSWNARNFSLLSFNAGVWKSLSWNAPNLYTLCFVFIRQLKELVGHVQYLMQQIVFNPVIDQVRGFSTNYYSDTQHLLLYPNKTNSPILACLHKTDKKKNEITPGRTRILGKPLWFALSVEVCWFQVAENQWLEWTPIQRPVYCPV